MYSYYHGKLPLFFNNVFNTNDALHSHNTRSVSQIHIEFNRTNYGKFSITYWGAIVWNSLPREIRNINFYNLFKKLLKLYVQKMIPNEYLIFRIENVKYVDANL